MHVREAGKPDGKSPLGQSRHRWKDNITIYLKELRVQHFLERFKGLYSNVYMNTSRLNKTR
jgi:hypothetical protein